MERRASMGRQENGLASQRGRAPGCPLLLLAAACTAEAVPPHSVERHDSAGIEVVASYGPDRLLDWRLELLFEPRGDVVGGGEDAPGPFRDANFNTVAADGLGNLHVLDASAHRVWVFGPEGKVVRTLGSRGQGRGGLVRPRALAVEEDGTVWVLDEAKRALVRYAPDGRALREVPAFFAPLAPHQRAFAVTPSGVVLGGLEPRTTEGRAARLSRLREGRETRLARHELPPPRTVRYPSCGGALSLPPLFLGEIAWAQRGDVVAVGPLPEYRIDVHEGDRPVRSLRRDLPRRVVTRDLARTELGEGFRVDFGSGPCSIPPGEMVDGRGHADWLPAFGGLALSPAGELWALRRVAGVVGGPVDVFGPDGAYLGTLPAGFPFPAAFLGDDRVAVVEADASGGQRVRVYGLVRDR